MTPEHKKIAWTAGAAAAVAGVLGAILFWPRSAQAQPFAALLGDQGAPPTKPNPTTLNFTAGSGSEAWLPNPGHTTAHVGDMLIIGGAPPYSAQQPQGVAVYAAGGVVAQDPASTTLWHFTGPGEVHLAWGAGPWGKAGELYFQVS